MIKTSYKGKKTNRLVTKLMDKHDQYVLLGLEGYTGVIKNVYSRDGKISGIFINPATKVKVKVTRVNGVLWSDGKSALIP